MALNFGIEILLGSLDVLVGSFGVLRGKSLDVLLGNFTISCIINLWLKKRTE